MYFSGTIKGENYFRFCFQVPLEKIKSNLLTMFFEVRHDLVSPTSVPELYDHRHFYSLLLTTLQPHGLSSIPSSFQSVSCLGTLHCPQSTLRAPISIFKSQFCLQGPFPDHTNRNIPLHPGYSIQHSFPSFILPICSFVSFLSFPLEHVRARVPQCLEQHQAPRRCSMNSSRSKE